MVKIVHRTSYIVHRKSYIVHRTSYICHQIPNILSAFLVVTSATASKVTPFISAIF